MVVEGFPQHSLQIPGAGGGEGGLNRQKLEGQNLEQQKSVPNYATAFSGL